MKAGLILAAIIVAVVALQFGFIREAAKNAKPNADTKTAATENATVPATPAVQSVTPTPAKPADGTPPPASASGANAKPETGAAKPDDKPADPPGKKKKKRNKPANNPNNPNGGFFEIPHEAFPLTADVGKDNPIRQAAIQSMAAKVDTGESKLKSVVAEVNGEPITYRDLLRACVSRHGEQAVGGQVNERVLLAELKGRAEMAKKDDDKFEVTDKDIDEGEKRLIEENPQLKGKTKDEILKMLKMTPEYFRYQVYINVLSEKMFMDDNDITDRKDLNPMFMGIWAQNLTGRYKSISRFGEEGEKLANDDYATIGDATITTTDLAPFIILGLTKPRQDKALDDAIDQALVRQEFKAKGIQVSDGDVIARVEEERAKYRGDLFGYEAFLPFLDTTLPLECEKYRVWLGLDKMMGKPTDEQIKAQFEKYLPFFGSATASACEITTLAVDPETELPKTPDAWEKALDRIEKPIAELSSGGDFNQLVMRYSEDGPDVKKMAQTERTKENVAGYIGSFACRKGRPEIDPAIAALTFALRDDDWAGPVKTSRGYHLIRCCESSPPRAAGLEPEKFTDRNGNGKYDWQEPLSVDNNRNGKFDDGEPYTDTNQNGKWDAGEPFTDQNGNGKYDPPDQYQDLDGNGKWDDAEEYVDSIPNGHYDAGCRDQVIDDLLEDRAREFVASLRAKAKIVKK
ncbi:MAG: peptidylprolyl isomerase [Planctomycetes bacterium]|nr:peptidylprolyl isomerase [Planctomycetota bacterium]